MPLKSKAMGEMSSQGTLDPTKKHQALNNINAVKKLLWYHHLIEQLRAMHKSIGLRQMSRSMFAKRDRDGLVQQDKLADWLFNTSNPDIQHNISLD